MACFRKSFWKTWVRVTRKTDCSMGDTGSGKTIVARNFFILKECFQLWIPVKIAFTVICSGRISKILEIISKTEQATEIKDINELGELGEAKPVLICKSKLDVSELTFGYVIANMNEMEKISQLLDLEYIQLSIKTFFQMHWIERP